MSSEAQRHQSPGPFIVETKKNDTDIIIYRALIGSLQTKHTIVRIILIEHCNFFCSIYNDWFLERNKKCLQNKIYPQMTC